MTDPRTTPHICSICRQKYFGYGNHAEPINGGRCCDVCNATLVIPTRIVLIYKGGKL